MRLIVNGEVRDLADGMTAHELVQELGLKPERLAIEVNGKIIRRADWPATRLADGDKIEVVHFVGGGLR